MVDRVRKGEKKKKNKGEGSKVAGSWGTERERDLLAAQMLNRWSFGNPE